jgi:hypothetical protein
VSLATICVVLFLVAFAFFQKDETDLWANRIMTFLFAVAAILALIQFVKWLSTHL